MKLATLALVVCSLLALESCSNSSVSPLKPGSESRVAGHTLACVRQKIGAIRVITPSQAFAGSAGVVMGVPGVVDSLAKAGGKGATHSPQDPGAQLETKLMQHLTSRFGMKQGPTFTVPAADASEKTFPRPDTGTDYALEIGPVSWLAVYFPTNWLRYRVVGFAKASLVDTHTGEVLGSGSFRSKPSESSEGLDHDEVMSDTDGKVTRLMNKAMSEIADQCAREVFVTSTRH